MADIALVAPHYDATTAQFSPNIGDLIAGEALSVGEAIYIKGADGKAYLADGSAADELAVFAGLASRTCLAGEPITVMRGCRFKFGSGMTPGVPLFVSVTAGALADAASVGGTTEVAHTISATDIMVLVTT